MIEKSKRYQGKQDDEYPRERGGLQLSGNDRAGLRPGDHADGERENHFAHCMKVALDIVRENRNGVCDQNEGLGSGRCDMYGNPKSRNHQRDVKWSTANPEKSGEKSKTRANPDSELEAEAVMVNPPVAVHDAALGP